MSALSQVYGLHAVRSLLIRAPARVRRLTLDARRAEARARVVLQRAPAAGGRVERRDARARAARLGDVAHQGVLAEVEPLAPWSEEQLLEAVTAQPGALLLALDSVQDPHNLGACLRSADACGVLAVIVPKDRAAGVNPTVRKVAAGAVETTPVVTVTNLVRALKLLQQAGTWVVGADMSGDKLAWESDLTGGRALVLGGEGAGLRELTRRTCDFLVRLPQVGAVESLNVSVACGMLLYEAVRQRGA